MKADSYFKRVEQQTATRFWINNVTRAEAKLAIENGARGCTQNPAYTWKMMTDEAERPYVDGILKGILAEEPDDARALEKLQQALVANIAACFLPIYEESGGREGFVSIQGDPFREDTETIVRYARENCAIAPNLMAKIPVTPCGLKAIEILAAERIPINATEVMSVRQALDVCEVYQRVTKGLANPAPIYVSHIAGIFDEYLRHAVEQCRIDISDDALWQAGISVAKKAHRMMRDRCPQVGFISGGARGLHHFTEMVGAEAVVTINWKGAAETLIEQDPPVICRFAQPTPDSVVDELCEKLEDYRKGYFVHAIEPSQYEDYGPVVLFRMNFEGAWESALAYIRKVARICP